MEGYINGDIYENLPMVSDEEIIKVVFEACPQIVTLSKLLYLVQYPKLYEYYNGHIVDLLICYKEFENIIRKNFIPVMEDGSFDYNYGDISSTHHCIVCIGYVPRNEDMMEIISYPWDMEFW